MRILIWLVILACAIVNARSAEARTWTARTGRQVVAEFVGVVYGKVRIKRTSDGQIFDVPLERLSDDDQAFVRLQSKAAPSPSDTSARKSASESQTPEDKQARPAKTAAKPTELFSIPRTISVAEVLVLLKGARISSQGCGGTGWNGASWGYYGNGYQSANLPWSKTPERVFAGFAYGRKPVEHHLIDFSGPGFRFARTDDSPLLVRIDESE